MRYTDIHSYSYRVHTLTMSQNFVPGSSGRFLGFCHQFGISRFFAFSRTLSSRVGTPWITLNFPHLLTYLGELARGVGDEHAGLSHGAVADDDALDGVGVVVHFETVSEVPSHSPVDNNFLASCLAISTGYCTPTPPPTSCTSLFPGLSRTDRC